MLIEHPFALRYYRGEKRSVVAQIVLGLNPSVCFRGAEMEKNKPLVFIYIHLNHVQHNHLLVYFLGLFASTSCIYLCVFSYCVVSR